MTQIRKIVLTAFIGISVASPALSQWEWAGGIPLGEYSSVGAAGNWIFVNGYYAGERMVCSPDAGESWFTTNIGPGPYGFVLATSISDTVLLSVAGGTVFSSLDHGHTWVRSDTGIVQGGVRSLAFSSGSGVPPKGILMAASTSAGVFASTDAGAHWFPSDSGLTTQMTTSITAIDSMLLLGTADRGIFRSVNNGATWTPAVNGLTDTSISRLASAAGQVFAASGTNIYRSTNRGSKWELIPHSVPDPVLNLTLIPTPGRGSGVAIFATTSSGFYRMAYSDSLWTRVKAAPVLYEIDYTLTSVDTALYTVAMTEVDCSMDLGNTWLPVGGYGAGANIVTGNVSSKYDHARLYSGLFVSTNYGSKWTGLRPVTDQIRPTAISVSRDTSALGYDRLTVGTDSGRVDFSGDGGKTWKILRPQDSPSRGYQCFDVAELDGIVFTSLQNNAYIHHPSDSVAGIYRTTNDGISWEKMNTAGLTDTLVITVDVMRGKSGGRVVFAGSWMHLFRSTDDGASWWENTATPVRTGKKFLKEVNGTLYLCTQGTIRVEYLPDGSVVQTNDSAGVYRSTDDGLTWVDVTGDLHATFVRGFAAVSVPQFPTRVFLAVCTDASFYTSTEGGRFWSPFAEGLPYFTFGAAVGADARFVYVGLQGGLRRPWLEAVLTSAGPAAPDHPAIFALDQNFPNPFNPKTIVSYKLSEVSNVRLVVCDILGREVALLVNERQNAGTHTVTFDASGYASGVYFYRLTAGTFVETRRMLLLK